MVCVKVEKFFGVIIILLLFFLIIFIVVFVFGIEVIMGWLLVRIIGIFEGKLKVVIVFFCIIKLILVVDNIFGNFFCGIKGSKSILFVW